jgi:hypothetical protein
MREVMKFVWYVVCAAALCGCRTAKESVPPRTATEQLLLSTAADHALADQHFVWLTGKHVFVEEKYFESYDKGYAVGLIRERLAADGALLVKTEDKADAIVEIRSGALSMNNEETLVGVPGMVLPVPLAGPVQTPELAFYRSKRSDSVAKFALFAYERASGRYLQSAPPLLGQSHFHLRKLMFISWRNTDVAELDRQPKSKAAKTEPAPQQPPK